MALNDKVSMCTKCKMGYFYPPGQTPTRDTCERCGAPLLHTQITAEENALIERVSEDRDFIMAMVKLHDEDIIAYKSKISQFRDEAKRAGFYGKPKVDNRPKCPTCGSVNIEKISAGKKVAGSLLFGLFSSDVRNTMHCKDCGAKW